MHYRNFLTLITLALLLATNIKILYAQQSIPVFQSGSDGHQSYRIPAIISLPNGDLLAFCEGRTHSSNDFGDINIVMKRSQDKGETWTAMQIIVDADSLQAGNPAPVVDRTDPQFPKGRIFLFYNTGNNHEYEVRKGLGLREVWFITSADQGYTWSTPVNITKSVHRPLQPSSNPDYLFMEDWRSYANTPGHAIQFTHGKYKGRIFVAANHSSGEPDPNFSDYAAHGFFTDDHGKNFQLGASVALPGSNESTAAPLSRNLLMMNSRNQKGDIRARIVSISRDGGITWDTTFFDRELPDPVNQGSLLWIGKNRGKHILAFSNTADTQKRDNLTIRISRDDGKTWSRSFLVEKSSGDYKGAFTAYSDLVKVSYNEIGILYERKNYGEIVFRRIKWK